MPGINGFEVIRRRTMERMPEIVFLTAYDQFALQAFEAAALDYLVKPVSEARFAATIKRLLKRLSTATPKTAPERLVATTSSGAVVLNIGDIDWIEAAGNYAQLWVGQRSYFLRESLHVLAERLRPQGFLRAHRRALVRLTSVQELTRDQTGTHVAVLSSGARILISRRRAAAFAVAVRQLEG
jgi:two-component system LytT family response regulator